MKQVGGRDKTPIVDRLAGQLADAEERIADLERKLAAAREALQAIAIALKEPAGGEYWTAREFLNKRDIFNEDLNGLRVLNQVALTALTEAGEGESGQ